MFRTLDYRSLFKAIFFQAIKKYLPGLNVTVTLAKIIITRKDIASL
jgi:hypothetical protein